jgi:multidrug resistance efflux pump
MKLRHPESTITQFHDSKAPDRTWRSKMTQWIYLAIIAFILLYAIYYMVFANFYFLQRGLVQVDHVIVASQRGGRILGIPISVNQHVKKGALLMRVDAPNDCRQTIGNREIATLKTKNALDRIKRSSLKKQLEFKQQELKKVRYRRSMELFAESNINLQNLENDLFSLQGNIDLLSSQIALRNRAAKQLQGIGFNSAGCQDEFIHAPADGTVIAINHKTFEVLQPTEAVMDFIRDDASVHIISNFNNDDYKSLTVGEEVDVKLPDGSISKGLVSEIKSTSIPFPTEEVLHYMPARTRILATITPLDAITLKQWQAFNEMEVEVTGWR